jgi:hypothetical protein
MSTTFTDPYIALTFVGVLFILALGIWLVSRPGPKPPRKPDSIWHEFKER